MEASELAAARRRSVVAAAKAAGLLSGDNRALGAQVPHRLIIQAKEGSGVSSMTDGAIDRSCGEAGMLARSTPFAPCRLPRFQCCAG